MTTAYRPRSAAVSGPFEFWCRDLVSCLQSSLATVLAHQGHDPLEVLGTHWEFRFRPGDVRHEEFYYPCAVPGDLAASIAPHHGISSTWRRPAVRQDNDPARLLAEVIEALTDGQLVIATVDNFFLPFRPAFGDVHAAHLLVVYGVDLDAGLVHVSDAMPPAFRGPIGLIDFISAWSSANPADSQDAFFSDARIDRRFLTLQVGTSVPRLDLRMLSAALAANLAGFHATGDGDDWTGLAGLGRFTSQLADACDRGDEAPLADAYPFGWGMQAQASLHAELLRQWGAQRAIPELSEAGRLVESVAHAWTGLRMTAAHGRDDPAGCARDLGRHAARLRRSYELALASLEEAVELL